MTQENQNFTIWQGTDNTLTITDVAGAPITGASITWVMKKSAIATVELITKKTGAGIVITDGAGGVFTVELDPVDTATINFGDYYHEARIVDSSGNEDVTIIGTVTLKASGTYGV
jgi:hypothetical protein